MIHPQMIVSIVGHSKTGKTAFALALVGAAGQLGFRVAAIKTGHHPASPAGPGELPDGTRLAYAGAHPVVFWGPEGAVRDGDTLEQLVSAPVPSREAFGRTWRELLPVQVVSEIEDADLLIVEGRRLPGAVLIQTHEDSHGPRKCDPSTVDWTVTDSAQSQRVIDELLMGLEEARAMPGRTKTKRTPRIRTVRLDVGGSQVRLNGFVQDVFRETLVGLVRSLGTEDEKAEIRITISPIEE